jgi:AraC-like DNA-binding protein
MEARVLALCALLLEAGTAALPDDPDLRHLISWSEERVADPPPVSKAAKEMGMSRSAFCRWFSARTGMGYAAYLEELRMEAAREHLVSGLSVSVAAARLGYGDCSYFVRRFRLRYGLTPGAVARDASRKGPRERPRAN